MLFGTDIVTQLYFGMHIVTQLYIADNINVGLNYMDQRIKPI